MPEYFLYKTIVYQMYAASNEVPYVIYFILCFK